MAKKVPDYVKNNPELYIPKGIYCYDSNGICPFWEKDDNKPYQHNGYCYYLGKGDWELNKEYEETSYISYSKNSDEIGEKFVDVMGEGFPHSLLWDQVKECGINDEF